MFQKCVFNFLVIFTGFLANEGYSQKFKSNYYYLGEIVDNRTPKMQSIGNIYTDGATISSPIFLQNGISSYLRKNLDSEMIHKRDPYFVNLALDQFNFQENIDKNKLINGEFNFRGSFFILKDSDSINIFQFKYEVKYKRQAYETEKLYELILSKTKELNGRLEKWFKENYEKNPKLARHVTVIATDFTPNEIDSDTLYFFQRKVVLDDFTPKTKSSGRFAAAIFTSMGYQAFVKMSNDTIYLNLEVKVYQIKGMSWILESEKTQYVLDHEQTHFNITQLVAEKFKERLHEEALPPQDYDSRIQFLYLDYYRMINRMQNIYDDETRHGVNKTEQARWEKYVENELKKYWNSKN
jgi:hypothetical protein